MKGSNSIQPARLGRLLTAPKEGDAFEARNHDDDDDDDDDNNNEQDKRVSEIKSGVDRGVGARS